MKIEIEGRKIELARVVGGLGWPAEKAGCCVVVGEEAIEPKFPKTSFEYRYHLLDELHEADMARLIQAATAFRKTYEVSSFYARLKRTEKKPLPAQHFLEVWNTTSFQRGVAPLYLVDAPHTQDRGLISFHLNVLKALLKAAQRTLFIPSTSLLNAQLLEVPTDVTSLIDTDFPGPAALAYACAALATWRQDRDEEWEMERLLQPLPPY
jgi:hypothetical protein